MPRHADHGVVIGAPDSILATRAAARRDPHWRQLAAASVRSSHARRSRSKAFAVTISFRMTAVTATLWGLPLSFIRP